MDNKALMFVIAMMSFLLGLSAGSHFTPSHEFISNVLFGTMFVLTLSGFIVGFGFLVVNLWDKRKQRRGR